MLKTPKFVTLNGALPLKQRWIISTAICEPKQFNSTRVLGAVECFLKFLRKDKAIYLSIIYRDIVTIVENELGK